MKARSVLTAVLLGTLALAAQDTEHSRASGSVELSLGSNSVDFVGAPKCDGSGNVYARPVIYGGDYFLAPTRAFKQDGTPTSTFSLTDVWTDAVGRGVFVDADGILYQAAIAPGGVYIVQFGKGGNFKSKTKLETQGFLDPWHLVVFKSGRFIISGTEGKAQRTPYTAVFEQDGKLLKKIYEPEDDDARDKAESGNPEFTHNADTGNRFIDLGDMALGSDGYAYLLHGTSSALLYVISPAGEVVRKMRIGADSSGLAFRSIEMRGDRLAIGLARFGRIEIHVMDLEGTPVERFVMNTDKSELPRLACYDTRGFTLITTGSKRGVHLVTAQP